MIMIRHWPLRADYRNEVDPGMSHTFNDRIHQVHEELADIVDDPGMSASLPQALLERLRAMRGMLLEETNTNP